MWGAVWAPSESNWESVQSRPLPPFLPKPWQEPEQQTDSSLFGKFASNSSADGGCARGKLITDSRFYKLNWQRICTISLPSSLCAEKLQESEQILIEA